MKYDDNSPENKLLKKTLGVFYSEKAKKETQYAKESERLERKFQKFGAKAKDIIENMIIKHPSLEFDMKYLDVHCGKPDDSRLYLVILSTGSFNKAITLSVMDENHNLIGLSFEKWDYSEITRDSERHNILVAILSYNILRETDDYLELNHFVKELERLRAEHAYNKAKLEIFSWNFNYFQSLLEYDLIRVDGNKLFFDEVEAKKNMNPSLGTKLSKMRKMKVAETTLDVIKNLKRDADDMLFKVYVELIEEL